MPSWRNTPVAAKYRNENDPIPKNLQKLIGTISELTGFDIFSFGNGKETDNLVYIKKA